MQSTGQTSTHDWSIVSIQGWVITKVIGPRLSGWLCALPRRRLAFGCASRGCVAQPHSRDYRAGLAWSTHYAGGDVRVEEGKRTMPIQVTKSDEGNSQDRSGQPIFEGGTVHGRELIPGGRSDHLSATVVQFGPGARTRPHTHTSDQLLYIVAGIGKVGDTEGEHVVSVGDSVLIPAGTEHWHGAGDTTSPMSHVTIMRSDSQTTVL
ncbi:MAG: cupin domain-containing protein [Dehalococcoidia bacterium]|nr:cupin domain-containing protein [Dehalococcoidia bacterium]